MEMVMAVEITHRRMSGGSGIEHIVMVKWRDTSDGDTGESSRATMVDWIDNKGGYAYVQGPSSRADVHTVHPSGRAAYIKTEPNRYGTDNLLALPTF